LRYATLLGGPSAKNSLVDCFSQGASLRFALDFDTHKSSLIFSLPKVSLKR